MIDIKKLAPLFVILLLAAPAAAEPWAVPAASLLGVKFQAPREIAKAVLAEAGGDAEKARALLKERIPKEQDAVKQAALKDALNALPRLKVVLALSGPAIVGKPIPLTVRVRNIGDDDVQAVFSLDGSWAGRTPGYRISIVEPNGALAQLPPSRGCGNVNPLDKTDFQRLKPGAEMDPFAQGSFGNPQLETWQPVAPGKYKVRVTVDYASTDPLKWNGAINGAIRDQGVEKLLKQVPNGVYEAELEIDVR